MKKTEVQKLSLGLYKIYWKDGGWSLAAVGSLPNGDRWLAPTNWVSLANEYSKEWRRVEKVEAITSVRI
jgi:hypothetical protein